MKKSLLIYLFTILTTGCVAQNKTIPSINWTGEKVKHNLSWASDVGAKIFPKGKTFNVKDYLAINDGKTMCTKQIQDAIDACSLAGGGTVTFEPGNYLTGALFIKKGVNFCIGKGVTLLASTNINDYPEFKTRVAGIEMVWPSAVII